MRFKTLLVLQVEAPFYFPGILTPWGEDAWAVTSLGPLHLGPLLQGT